MKIYEQIDPPMEPGWWWIRDEEILADDQWYPAYLTVGGGSPARISTVWPDGDGIMRTWEFEWDGEDWIQVSEFGYGEVTPSTWVKLERNPEAATDDEINNAIHFGVHEADSSPIGSMWMAADLAVKKLLRRVI